jgi:hypothetical protein
MDTSTFEFEPLPPRRWPTWLWRFSGSSACFVKIDGRVHEVPWSRSTTLPRPSSSGSIEVFHNAGTVPARKVEVDLRDATRVRFRARFLPFQRGDVAVDRSER